MLNAVLAGKLAGVVAGLSLATTGAAAATGRLPDPVQTAAVEGASHVGVTLPAPNKAAKDFPTTTAAKHEDSTSTTSTSAPTTGTAPDAPPANSVVTPPVVGCFTEVNDDNCSAHHEAEHSEGSEDHHRQKGKSTDKAAPTSVPTSTSAPKVGDDSKGRKGSDDVKKVSPSTTAATTPTSEDSHKSKGKGSDD